MAIHVLHASGTLAPFVERLESGVARAVDEAAGALGIEPASVDVVVRDAPRRVIPELGIGGFCVDASTVFVSLDSAHPGFEEVLDLHLAACVAHELHHAARRRGPGYGRTLRTALVSEGLADQFALELTGRRPPWVDALAPADAERLQALAEESYDEERYHHRRWFFGSDPDEIPRWAGYTLGFQLVGRYLDAHPGETAASLAAAPADLFT